MGTLNNLINFLVEDVALLGSEGASVDDILHSIDQFYKDRSESHIALTTPIGSSPVNKQRVDRNFKKSVWTWLTRHPGIAVGKSGEGNPLGLEQVEVQNTNASQPALKVYATEEQTWLAAAGHHRDHNKVAPKDFECLRIIASCRERGILQPDLIRITGQDKRSLPGRTDRLSSKGYIQKIPIFAASKRTSLLLLAKFARPELAGQSQDPNVEADLAVTHGLSDQIQHYGHSRFSPYEAHIRHLIETLKEEVILKWDDLKKKLGVFEDARTSKILAEAVRRFEKLEFLSRVRAMSETSKNGDLHRCVKFLKEPLSCDWDNFFERSGRLEFQSTAGEASQEDDETESLLDWPSEEVPKAPYGYDTGSLSFMDVDYASTSVSWDPDRSIGHALRDAVDEGGTDGLTLQDIKTRTVGAFFSRPTDHIMGRLVDHWELSQPPHLRHLGLIRDAAQSGKVGYYVHYTHDAFRTKVDRGEAIWNAVQTLQIPNTVVETDFYGFNTLERFQFHGDASNATLRQCAQALSRHSVSGHVETSGSKRLRAADSVTSDGEATARKKRAFSKGEVANDRLHQPNKAETNGPKKPRGRPRKYPLLDVASNSRALSRDELERIKTSQKRAFEYRLSKVKKDIAVLVDGGEAESQAQRVALAEHGMQEQQFLAAQSTRQGPKSGSGRSRSDTSYKPSLAAHGLVVYQRKRRTFKPSSRHQTLGHGPLHSDQILGYSPSCFSHGFFAEKAKTLTSRAPQSPTASYISSDGLPYLPSIAAHDLRNATWLSKSVPHLKAKRPKIDKKLCGKKRKSDEVNESPPDQAPINELAITAAKRSNFLQYMPSIAAHDARNASWLSRIIRDSTTNQSMKRAKRNKRRKAPEPDVIFVSDNLVSVRDISKGQSLAHETSSSSLTYEQQHTLIDGSGSGVFLGPVTTLKVEGARGRPRKCRLIVIRCLDKERLRSILSSASESLHESPHLTPHMNSTASREDCETFIDLNEHEGRIDVTSLCLSPALLNVSLLGNAQSQVMLSSETYHSKRGLTSLEGGASDLPRKKLRSLENHSQGNIAFAGLLAEKEASHQNPYYHRHLGAHASVKSLVEENPQSCANDQQEESLTPQCRKQNHGLSATQPYEHRGGQSADSKEEASGHNAQHMMLSKPRDKPVQTYEQDPAVNEAFQDSQSGQQQNETSSDSQILPQSTELEEAQDSALGKPETTALDSLYQMTYNESISEPTQTPRDDTLATIIESSERPESTDSALATYRETIPGAPEDLSLALQSEATDPVKEHMQTPRQNRWERGLLKTTSGKSLISSKVRRFGGSAAWSRKEAMLEMIRLQDGVYHGSGIELLRGLTSVLSAKGITAIPDRKTVIDIKKTLISEARIQEIHFTYQDKFGAMQTGTTVALSGIDPQEQAVRQLQNRIKLQHQPPVPDRSDSGLTSKRIEAINPKSDKLYANRLPIEDLPVKTLYPKRGSTMKAQRHTSRRRSGASFQESSIETDMDLTHKSRNLDISEEQEEQEIEQEEEEGDHHDGLEFQHEYPGGQEMLQATLIPISKQVRFTDDLKAMSKPPPKAQAYKALRRVPLPFVDLEGRDIQWSPSDGFLSGVELCTASVGKLKSRAGLKGASFKSMVDSVASWEQKYPVESFPLNGSGTWVHYRHPYGMLGFPKPVPIVHSQNREKLQKRNPALFKDNDIEVRGARGGLQSTHDEIYNEHEGVQRGFRRIQKRTHENMHDDMQGAQRRLRSNHNQMHNKVLGAPGELHSNHDEMRNKIQGAREGLRSSNDGMHDKIQEVHDEAEEISEAEGVAERKRIKLRGRRLGSDFDHNSDRDLIMAVVITRTLLGGVDATIDWDTVADGFNLGHEKDILSKRWIRLRVKFKALISRLTSRFQKIYIQAYYDRVVPSLNYDDTESYAWEWLLEWTKKELAGSPGAPSVLPSTRGELEAQYDLVDLKDPDEIDYYEAKSGSTIHQRHTLMHNSLRYVKDGVDRVGASPVGSLDLAKNWIRANAMTSTATYRPDYARQKLSLLPEESINRAVSELLSEKRISQENKGRAAPARTYQISDQFWSLFDFSMRTHHFNQAITFKMELDKTLEDGRIARFTDDPNDGETLALTNLVSFGMVQISQAKLPSHRFGLTTGDYRTRALNKEKFNFDLIVTPTRQYKKGLPLKPLPTLPGGSNGDSKFPVWSDINGVAVNVTWEKALCAVLSFLGVATYGCVSFLETKLQKSLERFEIELVLDWLVDADAAERNGLDGVRLKAWWWTILG